MNAVITARLPLERRYGANGATAIVEAIDRYAMATGSQIFLVDDPSSMSRAGLGAVSAPTADAITGVCRALHASTQASSIFLIGGDQIIPYWQVTNPVVDRSIDPDSVVLSDNPYGSTADTLDEYLSPSVPTGRLPNPSKGRADDFIRLIEGATNNHTTPPARAGTTAVVNRDWLPESQVVAEVLLQPVDWRLSPGYEIREGDRGDTNRRCLYFNLHGFQDEPGWKGFDTIRGQYFSVATPQSFVAEHVSGALIFAENCYGALTVGKTAANSCALRLLEQGVAGVVGATGLSFGSHVMPGYLLQNAELLARFFFESVNFTGEPMGSALRTAKNRFRFATSATDDVFGRKTLLQFTLLGDPSLN